MNNSKYLEIIPAIMALYCPIEITARIFMLVNAYDIEFKEAVAIIVVTLICNVIVSAIFIVINFIFIRFDR